MSLLQSIDSPADLKKLPIERLPELAEEIRNYIIGVVAQNGGHLASNLGVVELTIAIHYVFNLPTDRLIFDVGHQCYTHKILTGRREDFVRIRTRNGPSGFTKRSESEYDSFGAGHASTSIPAALGMALARDLSGKNHKVIAVIGDGSCTGGLTYEGLNQAGGMGRDMLIILNDNTMSISKNVGALSKYLTDIITDENYNKLKADIWNLTEKLPQKDKLRRTIAQAQEFIKGILVPGQIFERLGFRYFGPIDGHDIPLLIKTLNNIKDLHRPLLLHVLTKKGKGYSFAEDAPTHFHGVGAFDKQTGLSSSLKKTLPYTNVFGETLTSLAQDNDKICAITAAMTTGTGLTQFAHKFPQRFFDVGIAEQLGTMVSAALAAEGYRPFFAVYSTFLQRGYDQVVHDVALQKLPVVFCIDRAGVVGEDGSTHHGAFDIPYLMHIPNMTITAPKDGGEFRRLMVTAAGFTAGPFAIRYPRADIPENALGHELDELPYGVWEKLREGDDIAILAVGSMVYPAWKAADILDKDGIHATVVNCRFLKPFDKIMLDEILSKHRCIITIEEGAVYGGFGYYINAYVQENDFDNRKIKNLGLPDQFMTHDSRDNILAELGLNAEGIADSTLRFFESQKKSAKRTRKN
ncbi:MAG: 1-deoxy-D-xylulose-5-phosphate synthase [candidate division Zixibacteria bacterium]|nr:1-deoxy-D-xylulose-5-phosphate synthase [candidate division Zixibacteria bacterium]